MAGTTRIDFFKNAAAGTSPSFSWKGGKFCLVAQATWTAGNVKLQYQSLDGTTWVDVANSTLSANGMTGVLELPPCLLQAVAATGSAFYASLVEVPTNVRH